MHETWFTFGAHDGTDIAACRWWGDDPPRAIVQIAHGMGEHAARYGRLAEALVAAGYVVYTHDHRGHGRTAGTPQCHGDLGPGGWAALVADLATLRSRAREEHPGIPLVVVAHSMGSFAVQADLLDRHEEVDGVVLTGTSAVDVIAAGIDPAEPVDLSAFNAPFEPGRTGYEWLSRDPDEVDAYMADPACGFGLDTAALTSMIEGLAGVADPDRLSAIRDDLPILLLSGAADPLAGGGALVELVGDRYREAGVRDVTVTLYPDARHEIFNETNRDEVTADLLAWLDRVVAS
jgi:alpha-beta hydrolase superfamily lysophospholipase